MKGFDERIVVWDTLAAYRELGLFNLQSRALRYPRMSPVTRADMDRH